MKIPHAGHPITIEPAEQRVIVRAGERVVADTKSALALREASYPVVYYVPLADVDEAMLKPTDSQTYCPFKGNASYYTIVADGTELTDAVWTYRDPYPAVQQIAGHVAFYPNKVEIAAE